MTARYLFDRWGTCFGQVDEGHGYIDVEGRHVVTVMSDGLVVASDGSRFGRIDAQGQLWSEAGVSLGYLGPVVKGPGPADLFFGGTRSVVSSPAHEKR